MFNQATKDFCAKLKIGLPIIQAPMAGKIVTPELIAEVAKAQGLGSLPLGYLSLDHAKTMIQETKRLTPHFAVNVFISTPNHQPNLKNLENMLKQINQCRAQLGLNCLSTIPPYQESSMDSLIDMIIDENVPILSFAFGILNDKLISRLKQNGIYIIGTATTVAEGQALEKAGCDAVIAQGYEAGGHRGGFLNDHGGLIGTIALIPQMVDALKIPVIAAGGIMDGRSIAAAIALGASAVQMGTAFLTCTESSAAQEHKQMVLQKPAEETHLTTAFTGKPVRCFKNEFVQEMEKTFTQDEILPYPLQHQLTKELRAKAIELKQANFAGFWSGQATSLARTLLAGELIKKLLEETQNELSRSISNEG